MRRLARKALGHDLLDRAVHAPVFLFPKPLLGELVQVRETFRATPT
jgi:hypothetical protein